MTERHYCHQHGHGEMCPVWSDGTDSARLRAWVCNKCLAYDGLRPGEETITRGDYESGRLRKD